MDRLSRPAAGSLWSHTTGPLGARIALVGEAWGADEAASGLPFVGASGRLLDGLLREAGFSRDDCFVTNLINAQPPGNLLANPTYFHPIADKPRLEFRKLHPTELTLGELARLHLQLQIVRPTVVLALGNYALWAMASVGGHGPAKDHRGKALGLRAPTGIMNWRGSMIQTEPPFGDPTRLLPCVHPAAVLRQWELRATVLHDLRVRLRQALDGDWAPQVPPHIMAPGTYEEILGRLDLMLRSVERNPTRIAVDIETKRYPFPHITCISLCDGPHFSMSIPFVRPQSRERFWATDQEATILHRLRLLLTHPSTLVEGQNFTYDLQYLIDYPGITFQHSWDTMAAQHVMFPGQPKDLAYLSSLYCKHHRFWKEDSKEWNEKGDIGLHLRYNAEDSLRTYEIASRQREIIPRLGLGPQLEYLHQATGLALDMMRRGIRVLAPERAALRDDVGRAGLRLNTWFEAHLPQELVADRLLGLQKVRWWRSSKQTIAVLESWGLVVPKNRKSGNPSVGKDEIAQLLERYPGFSKVFLNLLALRSLGVFEKTFLRAQLDPDGRMRCNFNPAGPETFRWSSSKNAQGRGLNLQNIPVLSRTIGALDAQDPDFDPTLLHPGDAPEDEPAAALSA